MTKAKRKRTATKTNGFDADAWLKSFPRYKGCRLCAHKEMREMTDKILAAAKRQGSMVPIFALRNLLAEKFSSVKLTNWIVGKHLRECRKHGLKV